MAYIKDCHAPLWRPKLWSKLNDIPILENTNCYSYAFNYVDYREKKLQPGEISNNIEVSSYTCENFHKKLKEDYPEILLSNENENFKDCSRYKIALFIDTMEGNEDYHFYRQDANGNWSHKPGSNDVTNLDASCSIIKNPEKADRNYRETNKQKNKGCDNEDNNRVDNGDDNEGDNEGDNEEDDRVDNGEDNGGDNSNSHNYSTFCNYYSLPVKEGPIIRIV
tara:strand:+ start:8769 stop:9434 length:666 start_codon:yes stop_codon:yes gene_type:complete